MAKEITQKLKDIIEVLDESDTTDWCTVLCEVEWNGKPTKGLDIRTCNMKEKKVYKGISLSHESLGKLTKKLISLGYDKFNDPKEDLEEIFNDEEDETEDYVDEDASRFTKSDFAKMFKRVSDEGKYHRCSMGYLRDEEGFIVIQRV